MEWLILFSPQNSTRDVALNSSNCWYWARTEKDIRLIIEANKFSIASKRRNYCEKQKLYSTPIKAILNPFHKCPCLFIIKKQKLIWLHGLPAALSWLILNGCFWFALIWDWLGGFSTAVVTVGVNWWQKRRRQQEWNGEKGGILSPQNSSLSQDPTTRPILQPDHHRRCASVLCMAWWLWNMIHEAPEYSILNLPSVHFRNCAILIIPPPLSYLWYNQCLFSECSNLWHGI